MKLTLARKYKMAEGKIFKAKIRRNTRCVSLQLPKNVADYLQIPENGELYWTALDNTIQLTGTNPKVGIPLFEFKPGKFLEQ